MSNNHFTGFESAQKLTLAKQISTKFSFKLLFGTDMFTFDIRFC